MAAARERRPRRVIQYLRRCAGLLDLIEGPAQTRTLGP